MHRDTPHKCPLVFFRKKHALPGSLSGLPARYAQICIFRQVLRYWIIFLVASGIAGSSLATSVADDSDRHSGQQLNEAALDRQIDNVLEHPEFDWRLPNTDQFTPLFERWLDSIRQAIFSFGGALDGILQRVLSLFRARQMFSPASNIGIPFSNGFLTSLAYLLAFGIAGTVTLFAFRVLVAHRRRQAKPAIVPREPDLTGEEVSANQLPADAWYALARQKIATGELRQGQRAIFLGILSCLGSRHLITVERWKSNCDYEIELGRRAKHIPDLTRLYAESRLEFERCWYGEYSVTRADLDRYGSIYERIKDAAP